MYMDEYKVATSLINVTVQNDSRLGTHPPDDSPIVFVVLKAVVMLMIMAGAVFGNILVILAVIKFERLRAITNYFIVSLAFADLLVSILVMPFNASFTISGKWIFGRIMCDIYNSNDVLFSTASILHICCISMDRYIAIMHPLQYETKMTRCRVAVMLTVTWVSSTLISYIPIHSQLYTTEDTLSTMEQYPSDCLFVVNRYYAVVSSSVSFWIPCTIMVFVYIKIFIEARKQETQIKSTGYYTADRRPSSPYNNCLQVPEDQAQRRNERKRMKREHKAAKTLGIIMGAFVMCFLPFFSWYLITTLCGDSCPYPPILGSILFWLGYFNSCLNPIIYAYFNRDFRGAFRKLLKLDQCQNSDHSGTALAGNNSETRDTRNYHMLNYKNAATNGCTKTSL